MQSKTGSIAAIYIRAESPNQGEVVSLIASSDAYLASLYPAQSNHLIDVETLSRPEVTFLVARMAVTITGAPLLRRH